MLLQQQHDTYQRTQRMNSNLKWNKLNGKQRIHKPLTIVILNQNNKLMLTIALVNQILSTIKHSLALSWLGCILWIRFCYISYNSEISSTFFPQHHHLLLPPFFYLCFSLIARNKMFIFGLSFALFIVQLVSVCCQF